MRRGLDIRERRLGVDHPDVAQSLDNLAVLLGEAGRFDEAEPLFSRAIEVLEEALGANHSSVADSLENYAVMLRADERPDDAAMLEARAKAIRQHE